MLEVEVQHMEMSADRFQNSPSVPKGVADFDVPTDLQRGGH